MIDLLVLTSSYLLLLVQKIFFLFSCKTTYLNKEVNCTEPSPSVRVPCKCKYLAVNHESKKFYTTSLGDREAIRERE
jgi:hypothetical protein